MSEIYQSLSHSKWDCKYHVVFVPKPRRKAIFEVDPVFWTVSLSGKGALKMKESQCHKRERITHRA